MSLIFHQKTTFWLQSVSFLESRKDKWKLVFFTSAYVPLFLLIFQPYGVNNYDQTHSIDLSFFLAAIGFGFVNAVTLVVFEFLIAPYVFKNLNRLLFIVRIGIELILLASATFLYYNFLGNFHDWTLSSYFGFIRDISLMGIIPFGFIFLYLNYQKSREAFKQLQINTEQKPIDKLLKIQADNGKEYITISIHHLLFIEAQDNYVAVHHLENEKIKKSLLRTTMKKLEEQLASLSIIRCHRSFLVNLNSIEKVTGGANQLRLYLPKLENPIPVSRSYVPVLKQLLDIHHK